MTVHPDERFRLLLDAAPIPLIISRVSDGKILYANEHLGALAGLPPDELVGRETPDFYADPEDRKRVLERLAREGSLKNHEVRIKDKDGRILWAIFSLVSMELAGERVVVGGLYDITKRKQAEEALKKSETFVSAVLNTAGALVVVLDREGRIVSFNRACERTTGYSFEEVEGKPFWDLFLVPEEVDRVRKIFEELRAGHFPNEAENYWLTKSGERRLISWSNTALTGPEGAVEYIIGTGIDITRRRRAEDALHRISAEIERANQELKDVQGQLLRSEKMAALGSLIAGIAHEINTPVGAINSMHDTLVRAVGKLREILEMDFPDACSDNRQLQAVLKMIADANQVIATGTGRVIEIVRSLRSFARSDGAEMVEADLHEGIDNSLTLVHHEIKNRVQVVKEYGEIPQVRCFPNRLNQVFLNMLVNAAQAIEGEGKITITTSFDQGRVRVAIRDTGGGISEENLEKIFEPGFTTKGEGRGTGLGLSICRQIVQDHRGEIEVESRVGVGTTFTVVLPVDVDGGT